MHWYLSEPHRLIIKVILQFVQSETLQLSEKGLRRICFVLSSE